MEYLVASEEYWVVAFEEYWDILSV
jgi:hypothetical protein